MKKVFKKMKKRLSGEGNKKLEAQLSGRDSDSNDASSSSDRQKEVAPKPQSPRRPSTVQEEDIAKSAEEEISETPEAPASKTESQTKSPKKEVKKGGGANSDSESSEKHPVENGKDNGAGGSGSDTSNKKNKKKNKESLKDSEVIKTYSDVPMLEINKLPRGGVSIDTKAVGRVQVRYDACFCRRCRF